MMARSVALARTIIEVAIMAASNLGTDTPADAGTRNTGASQSIFARVKQSLVASAGDIVFGMEDGTVSIFGLVFGVAASSTSSAPVLLAGATGAVSAAVSRMAGVFLDVQTSRGIAKYD